MPNPLANHSRPGPRLDAPTLRELLARMDAPEVRWAGRAFFGAKIKAIIIQMLGEAAQQEWATRSHSCRYAPDGTLVRSGIELRPGDDPALVALDRAREADCAQYAKEMVERQEAPRED
jgi:hypothetical protein